MTRLRLIFTLLLAGSVVLQSSTTAQETLDRTVRPKLGPTPEVRLPKIQKAELPNGLKVWLVEAHKVPIVAFNLVMFAGSERDPLTTPGLASMTAAMIQEGTPTRTSLQIADETRRHRCGDEYLLPDGLRRRIAELPDKAPGCCACCVRGRAYTPNDTG